MVNQKWDETDVMGDREWDGVGAVVYVCIWSGTCRHLRGNGVELRIIKLLVLI